MDTSIQTERLTLTTLTQQHALKLLHFYERNKEHFEPWEPDRVPSFYTIQFQRLTLAMEQQLLQKNKVFRLWIFLKGDPTTIIGSINFYNIVFDPFYSCQIGYKIDKNYLGKGYAFEASKAAIQLLFRNYPNLHRIEANIMPSNASSLKLIHKLGFEYEGTSIASIRINHNWEDHKKYAYIHKYVNIESIEEN